MSPSAAKHAAMPVNRLSEASVKNSKQFAQIAAQNAKFPSSPVRTDPFIARIASTKEKSRNNLT